MDCYFIESTQNLWRIGNDKFEKDKGFLGHISCLQYFDQALSSAQLKYLKNCTFSSNYHSSICPLGYKFIGEHCFKVKYYVKSDRHKMRSRLSEKILPQLNVNDFMKIKVVIL